MGEEKQEQMQKKYFEYQTLEQQMKQIKEQLEMFDKQLSDLNDVRNALAEIGTIKEGTEILVPISSGIFLKAKIDATNKVLVNVGAGTTVEKPLNEASGLLDDQEVEINKAKVKLNGNAMMMGQHLSKIQQELKALVEE